MSADAIRILMYVVIAVLIGLYVLFILWRVRVDRAKKAAAALGDPSAPVRPATISALASSTPPPAAALSADLAEREARVLAAAERLTGKAPEVTAEEALGVTDVDEPGPAPSPATAPADEGAPPPAPSVTTVAELLAGIRLPEGLVPLTTLAPRIGAMDRVAFAGTGERVEEVGPAFAASLEAIGITVDHAGFDTLELRRGAERAKAMIHPDAQAAVVDGRPAFPTAPEHTIVIEVWIPTA